MKLTPKNHDESTSLGYFIRKKKGSKGRKGATSSSRKKASKKGKEK